MNVKRVKSGGSFKARHVYISIYIYKINYCKHSVACTISSLLERVNAKTIIVVCIDFNRKEQSFYDAMNDHQSSIKVAESSCMVVCL